ncbi:hypothetical protein [Roseomonas chloroacetimidivorans]|uniref:hypothetical protein n=1 Tax=Roseomonas chloroacetimidivorans TaxID=1766656 RepID=UPI003C77115B
MSVIVDPIHTHVVNGHPVRFFRSPFQGPDMPWHGAEDLLKALDLPREFRRQQISRLHSEWKSDIRTVATADGIVVIAPHFMARGMIDGMKQIGRLTDDVDADYCHGASAAMEVITADIADPVGQFEYVMHAFKRHGAHGEAH